MHTKVGLQVPAGDLAALKLKPKSTKRTTSVPVSTSVTLGAWYTSTSFCVVVQFSSSQRMDITLSQFGSLDLSCQTPNRRFSNSVGRSHSLSLVEPPLLLKAKLPPNNFPKLLGDFWDNQAIAFLGFFTNVLRPLSWKDILHAKPRKWSPLSSTLQFTHRFLEAEPSGWSSSLKTIAFLRLRRGVRRSTRMFLFETLVGCGGGNSGERADGDLCEPAGPHPVLDLEVVPGQAVQALDCLDGQKKPAVFKKSLPFQKRACRSAAAGALEIEGSVGAVSFSSKCASTCHLSIRTQNEDASGKHRGWSWAAVRTRMTVLRHIVFHTSHQNSQRTSPASMSNTGSPQHRQGSRDGSRR